MQGFLLSMFMWFMGAAAGYMLYRTAVWLILARVESLPAHWLITGRYAALLWTLLNAAAWFCFFLLYGVGLMTFECIFVFSVCLVISAVDLTIRKIPNEALFIIVMAFIVFLLWGQTFSRIQDHIGGMAAGLGLFLAPFLIGRRSGSGDIKYAASIGLFLGLYNSLLAFVIMSALFFLYVSVLFITQKGGFKTKIALGPYMSAGFFIAFLMLGGIR